MVNDENNENSVQLIQPLIEHNIIVYQNNNVQTNSVFCRFYNLTNRNVDVVWNPQVNSIIFKKNFFLFNY